MSLPAIEVGHGYVIKMDKDIVKQHVYTRLFKQQLHIIFVPSSTFSVEYRDIVYVMDLHRNIYFSISFHFCTGVRAHKYFYASRSAHA